MAAVGGGGVVRHPRLRIFLVSEEVGEGLGAELSRTLTFTGSFW